MTELNHKFRDNPLGEGFYADEVVKEKNVELGSEYFTLLREARQIVHTGKMTMRSLEALHRYKRITEWISYQYGKLPCKTQEEADTFLKAKIFELMAFEGDCWLFWEWLRSKTLEEGWEARKR